MQGKIEEENPITATEKVALARLAEIIAEYSELDYNDIYWLRKVFSFEGFNTPYNYSEAWSIDNDVRRRFHLSFLKSIYNNKDFSRAMGEFLTKLLKLRETFKHDYRYEKHLEKWSLMIRVFSVLGYELTEGENEFGEQSAVLLPAEGGITRTKERNKLLEKLNSRFPTVASAMMGAYQSYTLRGEDSGRQTFASLRNALDNIVTEITNKPISEGIAYLSQDSKSRLDVFKKLRHYLGSKGPHSQKPPEDTEILLGIRLVEDSMVWILKRAKQW